MAAPPPIARSAALDRTTPSFWLSAVLPSVQRLEVAIVTALVLVALAVRWPELLTVPRFTDEMEEVMLALRIASGSGLPLTNSEPHIGSLFNYLVAAGFLILGPKMEVGRLVAMLFGALTIVPTYLLGRSIGGPAVGLLSALLLATSAVHVAVSSHIAYSHSIMPLFSTTGLWLLHRAVKARSGPHLVASGLAFGLALQTHPSVLAISPGLAILLFWHGRTLIRHWLVPAVGAALVAVSNLVVFNATNGLAGVATAVLRSNQYLAQQPVGQDAWGDRLLVLLLQVPASLAGLVGESSDPWAPPLYPLVAGYAMLTLVGLVLLCRRGEWLPCLAVVSGVLLISFLNGKLEPVVARGRHYALLLPLGYVAMSVSLIAAHRMTIQVALRLRIVEARLIQAIGVGLALAIAGAPLLRLHAYYETAHLEGRTNLPALATLEAISISGPLEERIYVDHALSSADTLSGGRLHRILRVGLTLRHQDYQEVDLQPGILPLGGSPDESRRLVLRADNVIRAAGWYRLEPLPGEPGGGAPLRAFRAYPREPP
jgi:4-amino-4-deoxy-L-arabinose transferase-like glycosyltransferase